MVDDREAGSKGSDPKQTKRSSSKSVEDLIKSKREKLKTWKDPQGRSSFTSGVFGRSADLLGAFYEEEEKETLALEEQAAVQFDNTSRGTDAFPLSMKIPGMNGTVAGANFMEYDGIVRSDSGGNETHRYSGHLGDCMTWSPSTRCELDVTLDKDRCFTKALVYYDPPISMAHFSDGGMGGKLSLTDVGHIEITLNKDSSYTMRFDNEQSSVTVTGHPFNSVRVTADGQTVPNFVNELDDN